MSDAIAPAPAAEPSVPRDAPPDPRIGDPKIGSPGTVDPRTGDPRTVNPRIWAAAKKFEAMAIGQLLAPMFDTVDTAHSLFGGGDAESSWKPMLVEAIGKQIEAHGGLGLAQPVYAAMLRAQEGRTQQAGAQEGRTQQAGAPAGGAPAGPQAGAVALGVQAGAVALGSALVGTQAVAATAGTAGQSAPRPVTPQPRKTR